MLPVFNDCSLPIFAKMQSFQPQPGLDLLKILLRCHQLEKAIATSARLSVDELYCVSQLYVNAPCCVKTLCELVGIPPTRASRLLHDLEKRGYITRTLGFSDKRKELLALTPEGVSAAQNLLQSCAISIRDLSGSPSKDAWKLFASILSPGASEVM